MRRGLEFRQHALRLGVSQSAELVIGQGETDLTPAVVWPGSRTRMWARSKSRPATRSRRSLDSRSRPTDPRGPEQWRPDTRRGPPRCWRAAANRAAPKERCARCGLSGSSTTARRAAAMPGSVWPIRDGEQAIVLQGFFTCALPGARRKRRRLVLLVGSSEIQCSGLEVVGQRHMPLGKIRRERNRPCATSAVPTGRSSPADPGPGVIPAKELRAP